MVVSPDGQKIAYDKLDIHTGIPSIFIYSLNSRNTIRLTDSICIVPCWSRDGAFIYYFDSGMLNQGNLVKKRSDGSGEPILVAHSGTEGGPLPMDVSPDGRYVLATNGALSSSELFMVHLHDAQSPHTVERLGYKGTFGAFSPDGKWIVYGPYKPGKYYVSSFNGVSGKWQLPADAIHGAIWSKGKIIYYHSTANRYEYCVVTFPNGTPEFGNPKPVFESSSLKDFTMYGTSKEGNRYLGLRPVNTRAGITLSIIANWKGLLGKNN